MTIADDLALTAVTAGAHALAPHFPDVSTHRLERAAEAVIAAVRPFLHPHALDDAERAQLAEIVEEVRGGTVTT